jgi:hypothetical protein
MGAICPDDHLSYLEAAGLESRGRGREYFENPYRTGTLPPPLQKAKSLLKIRVSLKSINSVLVHPQRIAIPHLVYMVQA